MLCKKLDMSCKIRQHMNCNVFFRCLHFVKCDYDISSSRDLRHGLLVVTLVTFTYISIFICIHVYFTILHDYEAFRDHTHVKI